MRYHLRSEVRSCQQNTYKNCSSNENIVPSVELNFTQISDYHFIFADGESLNPSIEYAYNHSLNETHFCHQRSGMQKECIEIHKNFNNDSSIQNVEALFLGYPIDQFGLMYNSLRFSEGRRCYQYNNTYLTCFKNDGFEQFINDMQLHWYSNHRPLGHLQATKNTNKIIIKILSDFCGKLKSCTHCLMHGVIEDCIWSNSRCEKDIDSVKQTVDYCFKIARISPLMFNSSSPETLTIELDESLDFDDTQEYLVIKAGPHNHCTNIKPNHNGLIFNCSLQLSESGKFKISVSLINNKYADTISTHSTEKVAIVAPEDDYLPIVILFFSGLFLILLIIVYLRSKKQQSKGPKKVSTSKISKFSDSKEKQ
uniref:Uncharacterized protein n=1 Tax=Tetranychus urticae TaxID=32264 RepID=A0A158P4T0_TETUR